jgi:uncharacterized membrane protein
VGFTCPHSLVIQNGKSSHKGSIVKAIFYRAVSVVIVGLISYLIASSSTSSSKISVAFVLIETAWYYSNERLGIRIKWDKEESEGTLNKRGELKPPLEAQSKNREAH